MKKDKLIIVDLDGTLFDTAEVNYLAYKYALGMFGYDLERKFYQYECDGRNYKDYLPQITRNNDMELIEKIHKQKKIYYKKYLLEASLNKALLSILINMSKDSYLALVTTASRKNANDILNYFNLNSLFDVVIAQEDVNNVKPDPEGFIKAMENFDISPMNTIIFEDSEIGITAARQTNANIFSIIKF